MSITINYSIWTLTPKEGCKIVDPSEKTHCSTHCSAEPGRDCVCHYARDWGNMCEDEDYRVKDMSVVLELEKYPTLRIYKGVDIKSDSYNKKVRDVLEQMHAIGNGECLCGLKEKFVLVESVWKKF